LGLRSTPLSRKLMSYACLISIGTTIHTTLS